MSRKDLRAYIGLAAILLASSVTIANADTLPLKKLSVDAAKQLVIEFGGAEGAFPTAPHVLDLPGPNHRVVLDFTDVSIDKSNLPPAEDVSAALSQRLPFIKSVRYSELTNSQTPTARIVLDLPQDIKVKPHVVKMEQSAITISFGDVEHVVVAAPAPAPVVAAAGAVEPVPVAPVAPLPQPESVVSAMPAAQVAPPVTLAQPAERFVPGNVPVAAGNAPAVSSGTAATGGGAANWEWNGGSTAAAPVQAGGQPVAGAAPAQAELPALKGPISVGGAENNHAGATVNTANNANFGEAAVSGTAADTAGGDNIPGPEAMGTAPADAAAMAPAAGAGAPEPVAATEADKKLASVKHYNSAVQLHLQGKLTEAIAEYKAALETNPSLAEAHSNLGLIYNQQHNYALALGEFRKALAANPKDAITYNGIGAALRAEKDLQGAIKNWQTAVSLDAKLATAHYNLGTAYEIEKEYDKALASYAEAVKNDYRLGEAYYRMGLIMERKRRPEDAVEQFKEALKVSGDSEYSEDARQRLAFLTQSKKGASKTK